MEEKGKGIKTEGNTEARRRVPGGWRPVDGGSCMMDWKSGDKNFVGCSLHLG